MREFDINFLLELSLFKYPRFKLNYVDNRAEVMEEVERQMRGLIQPDSSSVGDASRLPSSSQPSSSGTATPPAKKARGLSKVHITSNRWTCLKPERVDNLVFFGS